MTNGLSRLHGSPGAREQTVLTPALVLDPLRSVWDVIAFDPSAPPPGPVWVACDLCEGTGIRKNARGRPCRCGPEHGAWYEHTVRAIHECRLPENGLAKRWIDRTYCNPEYAVLEPWLDPATTEAARVAWLIPVRPHRKWWRAWARRCDLVVYLNPFAFVGHVQTIPIPICLGYRGADAAEIETAFREIGEAI